MGILDWFGKSKPGKDEFAKLYEKYLRDRRLITNLQYDAADFVFRVEGTVSQTMGLDNIYRDYCNASREERQNVLRRYSEGAKLEEVPESWEIVRGHLMPVIRPAAQNEMMRLSQLAEQGHSKGADNFLFRPYSDDSVAMIAHDRPDSMMMVNKDTLEKWGVGFDEAWQACLDNLRNNSPEKPSRLEAGVVQCLWNDSYDSSRILLPDVLSRSGAGVDPVIMIPTRGCLLIAPANNPQAQSRMVDYAAESIEKHGRFVSALMYRQSASGLTRYLPTEAATVRKLHDLRTRALISEYKPQRDLMEKIDKKNGRDLFHANFMVYESKGRGGLVSLATVTRNALGTIPQADIIAFSVAQPNGEQGVKLVAWDDAMKIADGWLIKDDLSYPPRYRVDGFPAQDKLEAVPVASI